MKLNKLMSLEKKELKEILNRNGLILMKRFFKILIDNENASEFLRNRLSQKNPNFAEIFEFMDANKNGFIEAQEIVRYFDTQGYKIRDHEIILLIRLFVGNSNDKIDSQSFQRELRVWIPQEN